eukprot:10070779-Karenia_brevis.AAC.1
MWEQGRVDELLNHVEGERDQILESRKQTKRSRDREGAVQLQQGRRAKKRTVKGCYGKAMMSFSDKGRVDATNAEREEWASALIPLSEAAAMAERD